MELGSFSFLTSFGDHLFQTCQIFVAGVKHSVIVDSFSNNVDRIRSRTWGQSACIFSSSCIDMVAARRLTLSHWCKASISKYLLFKLVTVSSHTRTALACNRDLLSIFDSTVLVVIELFKVFYVRSKFLSESVLTNINTLCTLSGDSVGTALCWPLAILSPSILHPLRARSISASDNYRHPSGTHCTPSSSCRRRSSVISHLGWNPGAPSSCRCLGYDAGCHNPRSVTPLSPPSGFISYCLWNLVKETGISSKCSWPGEKTWCWWSTQLVAGRGEHLRVPNLFRNGVLGILHHQDSKIAFPCRHSPPSTSSFILLLLPTRLVLDPSVHDLAGHIHHMRSQMYPGDDLGHHLLVCLRRSSNEVAPRMKSVHFLKPDTSATSTNRYYCSGYP